MKKIKLLLDFGAGPIWKEYINPDTMEEYTGVKIIDENKEIMELNDEIQDMFTKYYEANSHGVPMWFNKKQQKEDKQIMMSKINKLVEMLDEVNDGSFKIDDQISKIYKKL
jgi:translation elongation factor EF-Tu-like GTPase